MVTETDYTVVVHDGRIGFVDESGDELRFINFDTVERTAQRVDEDIAARLREVAEQDSEQDIGVEQ